MNNLKQAMTDIFRIVLVVALPVILILILLFLYRFLWPSSSLHTELPFPQQGKMIDQNTNSSMINSYNIQQGLTGVDICQTKLYFRYLNRSNTIT